MKIYLAAPYAHPDALVRQKRVMQASYVAAKLMERGHIVFSPLTHSTNIAPHINEKLCNQHSFWMQQDLPWLRECDMLMILPLEGWEKSKGVEEEIWQAAILRMPRAVIQANVKWITSVGFEKASELGTDICVMGDILDLDMEVN